MINKVKINRYIFTLFLVFNSIYKLSYSQTWEQTSSFPGTPRDDASYFKIGTRHFIGTGREVGFGCTRDFYFFDESTLSWGNSDPLPIGNERQYASAVSWNGKGYVFGGVDCSGNYFKDLWSYDPSTNSWSQSVSLPSTGRAGAVQFVIQDTLYIVGGRNLSGILNEVWAFSFNSQSWTQKNVIPSNGIWRGVAFKFQNNAFIGLGKNNLNNQTAHNSEILKYEASSDTWQVDPNLNFGQRSYVGFSQIDSLLFLFGGIDSTGLILTSVERINLANLSVDQLPHFSNVPRKGGVAFLVQNDLYYSTGISNDTRFNETWKLANVASLNDIDFEQVKVSPNPASDEIVISNISNLKIGKNLKLQDLSGKSVLIEEIKSKQQRIDVSHLKNGVYILTIGMENHRIVIQ
jgi:N-acetylneuraminic acid mutarotase